LYSTLNDSQVIFVSFLSSTFLEVYHLPASPVNFSLIYRTLYSSLQPRVLNNTSMLVSHASTTFGPSIPSNDLKWWLEKSQREQPRCSTRSLGLGIRNTALARYLVVSAMNCARNWVYFIVERWMWKFFITIFMVMCLLVNFAQKTASMRHDSVLKIMIITHSL